MRSAASGVTIIAGAAACDPGRGPAVWLATATVSAAIGGASLAYAGVIEVVVPPHAESKSAMSASHFFTRSRMGW